jgi:hypothetical protein
LCARSPSSSCVWPCFSFFVTNSTNNRQAWTTPEDYHLNFWLNANQREPVLTRRDYYATSSWLHSRTGHRRRCPKIRVEICYLNKL